jgi:hypothetical protein
MSNSLPTLSALELERHVTLEEAARLKGLHPETFEMSYGHLIKKVSPRCHRVRLRDLVTAEPNIQAARQQSQRRSSKRRAKLLAAEPAAS